MRPRLPGGLALLALGAACARYQPQPLDPGAHVAEYRARRLDDPALLEFVAAHAGPPADTGWSDRQLATAALRFRPELDRGRAEYALALAGERTAGARPRPGAEADVERAVSGPSAESPWVLALAARLTVELGGKRGARLLRARARTAVAEGGLRGTAADIVEEVRSATVAVWAAEGELEAAEAERAALADVAGLTEARFRESAVTSAELARARGDVQEAEAAALAARSRLLAARVALGRVVGVPARIADGTAVVPPDPSGCVWLGEVGPDSAGAVALTRRPEVAQALARYAQAEAELRLEVARLSPDLELGPGFIWDQGIGRWTLALALPGLLAGRNRGSVTEAEARRSVAARGVAEAQEKVLGELAEAVAACRGARGEVAGADSQVVAAEHRVALARAAYRRGETGRLDLAQAELAVLRARGLRDAAARRAAVAAIAVERSAAVWVGDARWPDPLSAELDEERP